MPSELPRAAADPLEGRALRAILDAVGHGIVVADPDGRFVLWNAAATRLLGADAADVGWAGWSRHYHLLLPDVDEPFPPERLPLVRALRGEAVDDGDVAVQPRASGRKVWLRCSARPLVDADGRPRGGVAVFEDVTERRRIETELREFAQSASHDLKAPLSGICGFAEALLEDHSAQLDATGREYARLIRAAARRMSSLLDGLLAHSRIDHEVGRARQVDLRDVVTDVLRDLEAVVIERRAQVTAPGPWPRVAGFPIAIRRLLYNLVDNALKFVSADRVPQVELRAAADHGTWSLSVRDNGIGIDPAFHGEVFELFRRLHPPEQFAGTGVGLALVKKIVHLHAGRVTVRSVPGEGATFTVEMPNTLPPS